MVQQKLSHAIPLCMTTIDKNRVSRTISKEELVSIHMGSEAICKGV